MREIVVAISGASGLKLGVKFAEYLPNDFTIHLILSSGAKAVLEHEGGYQNIEKMLDRDVIVQDDSNIGANIASGSYMCHSMVVIPCSMNTLAKISCGISDTLITRCAQVMIKERRALLLAPREMPFSSIALENMLKLSQLGVVIAPPILGYYSLSKNLDDMERFLVGKWYDSLKIENSLYKRWKGGEGR